jgi:plastocyanin
MAIPVGWRTLLRVAAAGQALGLGAASVMLGDAEAGAIAIATIVVLVLQRFRESAGAVLLGLLFFDTAFFTGAAALSNLADRAAPQATIGPATLAAIALTGVLASIANVWRRRTTASPSRSATATIFVVAVAFAAVALGSAVSSRGAPASGSNILRLEIKGAQYSTDALNATGRTVTVAVTNHDLFWHTFTIGALGVDLRVPVGDEKTVTFTAAPGTYLYVCGVPGHASFMRGVLTVP